METVSIGSKTAADVAALLRARNPLLWINSREEARVERFLMEGCASAGYEVRCADSADGITTFDGRPIDSDATDPAQWIAKIKASRSREVWILRDLPAWLRDPTVLRAVRSLVRKLPESPREQARAVIVLSPSGDVPPELQERAIVLNWPLPDRLEIAAILDASIAALPPDMQTAAAPNGMRESAIDAAIGLTAEEASSCFARSLVATRTIDPVAVASEKRRVIAREKVLEWFDPLPGGLDSVGGLDQLKGWLMARRSAFGAKARAYGLPAPRGALLVGVPGCGKSLTAKAIATAWSMPLLRLDLGALKSKFVGESEGNIRKALGVAETVGSCILWLDEIEKALAGATQGAADGGVSADALGVVLTWMEERKGGVFLVATSNDASVLPPELLNRFDQVFFVDLPSQSERVEILAAALRLHGRGALANGAIDRQVLAQATEGYTGRELARLIPDALYAAFADGEREVTTEDIAECIRRTVPVSKTASERITKIRDWAKGRARPASTPEATNTTGTRRIDI